MARSKAPNGAGGIRTRQLADGTTVYDVNWTYRDAYGKRARKEKRGFATEREAQQFRRRVTAEVDAGAHVPPSRLSLGAYLAEYLAGLRLKPQTVAKYTRDARLHITPHIGHLPLTGVTPRQLNDLYRLLQTQGSPGGDGPLSLTSVRHVHNLLSGMYTRAVKEGLMGGMPPTAWATPPTLRQARERRSPVTVWSAAELKDFLDGTWDDHYFPLWLLLASTGMRRGEALGLHWADVHLDEGWLSLRYSLGEHRHADGSRSLELGTVKGGVAHAIALDARTVEVLRGHQSAQRRDRLALGERWKDKDLVFARGCLWLRAGQHGGTPLDPDRVSEAFRRDAARLGLPPIRLHDLRHTWASLALASGQVDIKVVSERLGHANISITYDTYTHITPRMDRQAAQVVADMFG